MGWFESRELKEKKAAFRNLVAVSFADGHLDQGEVEALRFIAERMGLTKSQAEAVVRDPDSVEFVVPTDPQARVLQMIDMVTVMMADGELDRTEMVICVHLGEKLGFSLAEVKHLIEGIVTAIRAGLDPLGQDS